MSLSLQFTACEQSGCASFKVYDTTGLYSADNLTGWQAEAGDASGNPKISWVTAATLEVVIPGYESTPVTIDVHPTLPNTDETPFLVTTTVIATASSNTIVLTSLPDGIYTITYTVTGTTDADAPFTHAASGTFLFDCNVACCVTNFAMDYITCGCTGQKSDKFRNAYLKLKAMRMAACCGQIDKAELALEQLQDLCAGECGCG